MRSCLLLVLAGCIIFETFKLSDAVAVMSVDLGSEWMKIAIVKPGVPMEIVLNKESKRKTEVAVSLRDDERNFGSSAMSKGVRFPATTYFYLQDLLGKSLDNPLVQNYQKRFPYYNIKEDPESGNIFFVHDEAKSITYTPEELMAMILNNSRGLAEEYAQQPIDSCVITVPCFYSQAERKSILHAASLAGLKVAQLMDDNAAAALNYGVFRRSDINATSSYMLFYDMGASSTTASVVSYQVVKSSGLTDPQLAVKGVGFDRTLGGLEMELRLRDLLIKLFNEKKRTKSDVTKSPRAMAKLLKEAKRLKKVLSANVDHMAQIEGLIDDEDFKAKVTREDFELLCKDLWARVAKPMHDALDAAELHMDAISQIILVGGGTRVPKVQEMILMESGKNELGRNINADEAPALGASYQAAALSNAFKVKTFHVKSGATYPIEINFQRTSEGEDGTSVVKHVKRTLFQRSNPYPQRKVITFNRFYDNFNFSVNYGDVSFLDDTVQKILGSRNISDVELSGVKAAHEKWGAAENTEAKGVKAHFRMDESGVLNLESVESVYEENKTVTENVTALPSSDESTFQKIKDSFSSLFGGEGGDGDGAKSADAEAEEAESEKKSEETKSEGEEKKQEEGGAKSEEKSASADNSTAAADADKPKNETKTKIVKVKQSVPLDTIVASLDHKTPSPDTVKLSRSKLKELAEKDAAKLAREVALNKLESYIYDKKDKLYQDDYEKAMTDEERESITKALTEASEWMDDLDHQVEADVYDDKRKALKEVARPWLLRVKQRKDVLPLLKDLESTFNYSTHFLKAMQLLPEDAQIYTKIEIDMLDTLLNDTIKWKNDTMKEESALKPYQDPVMKPEDLKLKLGALNREVGYLLNKAKTAKPKPKPTEAPKTNDTKTDKSDTESAGGDGATSGGDKPSEDATTTPPPEAAEPPPTEPSTEEATTEEPATEHPKHHGEEL